MDDFLTKTEKRSFIRFVANHLHPEMAGVEMGQDGFSRS